MRFGFDQFIDGEQQPADRLWNDSVLAGSWSRERMSEVIETWESDRSGGLTDTASGIVSRSQNHDQARRIRSSTCTK